MRNWQDLLAPFAGKGRSKTAPRWWAAWTPTDGWAETKIFGWEHLKRDQDRDQLPQRLRSSQHSEAEGLIHDAVDNPIILELGLPTQNIAQTHLPIRSSDHLFRWKSVSSRQLIHFFRIKYESIPSRLPRIYFDLVWSYWIWRFAMYPMISRYILWILEYIPRLYLHCVLLYPSVSNDSPQQGLLGFNLWGWGR